MNETLKKALDELYPSIRAITQQLDQYSSPESGFKASELEIHKQGPHPAHWNFRYLDTCLLFTSHNSDEPVDPERQQKMDQLVLALRRVFVHADRFYPNYAALQALEDSKAWSWLNVGYIHYGSSTREGHDNAVISFTLVIDKKWRLDISFDWSDRFKPEQMFEGVWHCKLEFELNQE